MLAKIEELREGLRKSERRVADLILAQPNTVVNESVALLARRAGVSEPTVLRFCRAVGCKGYQDFKLRLAQDLATGVRYFHRGVAPGQPVAELVRTVFDGYIHALVRSRNNLDADSLERAISLLDGARRIELYGVGVGGVVAHDAQHRFVTLGAPCAAYADPVLQRASASVLDAEAVVVAFSLSGTDKELLDGVSLARDRGARVVAVTVSGSPLAARATVTLGIETERDADSFVPARLRAAHLVTTDLLVAGIRARRSDNAGGPPAPGAGGVTVP